MSKLNYIKSITVNSIDALRDEIDLCDYGKWIFRGQSNASWLLEPSINRFRQRLSRLKYGKKPLIGKEKLNWRYLMHQLEFELFNAYIQNNYPEQTFKIEKDLLKVLTRLQHFGCPTRLLDFTLLPYTALFFAAMENTDDLAVFSLRINDIEEIKCCSESMIERFWGEEGADSSQIYLYRPRYTNDRMKLQKSVFLLPSTTVLSFERIVSSSCLPIKKIILPGSLRSDIVRMLNKMNVGPSSVYPEAEGSIKSLSWEIEAKIYQ